MNIRLYNAQILTMEKDRAVFHGEIFVQDEKIAYVAEETELSRLKAEKVLPDIAWDREIDCKGNMLMPGFKDSHTHSAMTFLRSYADDVPLQKWLEEKVFPMEAKLSGEDIYHLVRLAVLEYLTSGITSIFDMYIAPDRTAEACMDMGMRCVLTSGLNDFTSSVERQEEEYLKWNGLGTGAGNDSENDLGAEKGRDFGNGEGSEKNKNLGKSLNSVGNDKNFGKKRESLVSYRMGFHAEYTCAEGLLKELSKLAHKYRAPVYTHLAETVAEVEGCKARHGATPAVYLDRLGLFEFGGGGYHCVHMTEEDMEVFHRRGLYAVTNPASNLKLASGVAPIAEFLRRGIPVAIGTDGPASNNCLDMFREMFLMSGLSKLREKDAASLDAVDVLRMATVQGAMAMGLEDADVLAKGKLADIIMIDLHQPNMQPIHNISKNIVYSGSKSNVCMTMINGRVLYQNGEFHVGEEPEKIYAQCAAIVKRVTA